MVLKTGEIIKSIFKNKNNRIRTVFKDKIDAEYLR
jgi:hypothetical protein